jgi:hypothetical protein
LESVAGGKAQAEKAVAEAMACGNGRRKSQPLSGSRRKRLAAEVAAAKAEAERISKERAAAELRMSEDLAASKALINRLNAEKESVEKAAEDELAALKAELERTAAAEQAAAEAAAAAKAEVADLATDKTDADKAWRRPVRGVAGGGAVCSGKGSCRERFCRANGGHSGRGGQDNSRKVAAEKALNEKLLNARTDFERLSDGGACRNSSDRGAPSGERRDRIARVSRSDSGQVSQRPGVRRIDRGNRHTRVCHGHTAPDRQSYFFDGSCPKNRKHPDNSTTANRNQTCRCPGAGRRKARCTRLSRRKVTETVSNVVKARPTIHTVKKKHTAASVSGKILQTSGRKRVAATKTAHERSEARRGAAVNMPQCDGNKYQAKPVAVTKRVAKNYTTAPPTVKPAAARSGMQ